MIAFWLLMKSGDIIQQGEWGYGDVDGLAKEVNEGYKKFLKKNGLEPEGLRPKKIAYGKGRGKKN
jgi:hypothetical protein